MSGERIYNVTFTPYYWIDGTEELHLLTNVAVGCWQELLYFRIGQCENYEL